MRVGLVVLFLTVLFLWVAGAPRPAAAFCRLPDGTVADAARPGRILHPEGTPICVRRAGPDCVGCASGFVHECRGGAWQPLVDSPCGGADPAGPQTEVPFRHCRYFDDRGMELRVDPEHVREAQQVGLIAGQRCEIVTCRFYDKFGDPVPYGRAAAQRIQEDLRSGALSLQSAECRRAEPGLGEGPRAAIARPNAGSAAFR